MFEDGRTDTAIFSQKITEEYNYKSTILTYADKFEKEDSKFLKPNDLKDLEKVRTGNLELMDIDLNI